jgi:hypothetical protein
VHPDSGGRLGSRSRCGGGDGRNFTPRLVGVHPDRSRFGGRLGSREVQLHLTISTPRLFWEACDCDGDGGLSGIFWNLPKK